MFKLLKKLFAAEQAQDFAQAAQLGEPISAMSASWFEPVRDLSEHERNRQQLFTMVARKEGAKAANEALEAFDKAFPGDDREQMEKDAQRMRAIDILRIDLQCENGAGYSATVYQDEETAQSVHYGLTAAEAVDEAIKRYTY